MVNIMYETPNERPIIQWDEAGMIGTHNEDPWESPTWDHSRRNHPWQELWREREGGIALRARIKLGSIPQAMTDELIASDSTSTTPSYIAPTELFVHLGPVMPVVLDNDLPENEYYGGIELSISGMGYFTWQPLTKYWSFAKRSSHLQKMLQICRVTFPAPALTEINSLRERLGGLFLNREEYQSGDWIVSVSESG